MKIGMVGMGKMGANMALRISRAGHGVVAFSRGDDRKKVALDAGAEPADSLSDLLGKLSSPKVVWLMIPAGSAVDASVSELRQGMSAGDVIIDGGNSHYVDSMRRAGDLAASGVAFLDAGTSGGVWGLENGYCLMVGGTEEACKSVEPIFRVLAPEKGYARVGGSGAGHFVKMVHNAVEYVMMEGLGEGFEILDASDFKLDLGQIAELWRHASVVRSWLLDLLADALARDPRLSKLEPWVEDSGEGRWTLSEAIDRGVPAPALADALFARFRSRQTNSFSARTLAALRNEFGGHAVKTK